MRKKKLQEECNIHNKNIFDNLHFNYWTFCDKKKHQYKSTRRSKKKNSDKFNLSFEYMLELHYKEQQLELSTRGKLSNFVQIRIAIF